MKSRLLAIVNNLPTYPLDKYIVARLDCGELWFYGTYTTEYEALSVRTELDSAIVLERVMA